ncbi:MAG: hypothetical protein E7257_11065 [Lachnospiraceae bacterium]|nr:hypothetical protein [Lachnospiraceae bacterium]
MSKRKQIEFQKSQIKYSTDLEKVLTTTNASCDLMYVDETCDEHNKRMKRVGKKVVVNKPSDSTICLCFALGMILIYVIYGWYRTGSLLPILSALLILFCACSFVVILVISEQIMDKNKVKHYYLTIDQTNFNVFQPRIMEGKLNILYNSSFDSNNSLLCLPDRDADELGYSGIIKLDNITSFVETNDGMFISATATVRCNTRTENSVKYMQAKESIPIKVYIQRGLYSQEFRHACRSTFFISDYVTKDKQEEMKFPDAIMEISPWDIPPYPELFKESSPQLDDCQVFFCEDENQPLKYRLSQFYRDEEGRVFYIQYKKFLSDNGNLENILEDNLAKELSKTREKRWGKYYADRCMKGYLDWNGRLGEAKVVYLKVLKVKKTANGKVRISYTSPNGMRRCFKVPGVFGELETWIQDNLTE